MWLKIEFNEEDLYDWTKEPTNILVSISESKTAPISETNKAFRISPIFPLIKKNAIVELNNNSIIFFNFDSPFQILGKINNKGSELLKESIFYSLGLSSILLIYTNEDILEEFLLITENKQRAHEKWIISNCIINKIEFKNTQIDVIDFKKIELTDYSSLGVTERAIIDEFAITINLVVPKLLTHLPTELDKIIRLIEEVNTLIKELVYVTTFIGVRPEGINDFSPERLKNPKHIQTVKHQNLDRIIQINSALSYISTQTFSGAIPILERRSLIRRNSLLGIGSGILALNTIARFIENCFSSVAFNAAITEKMRLAKPLSGIENLIQYDPSGWHNSTVNKFLKNEEELAYYKLPYFSGRLGFRETEYSIAAAIQSISSGASLEWSLMTLTHEMLHGHVREILASIFKGEDGVSTEEKRIVFFENYKTLCTKKNVDHCYLLEAIRNVIFSYSMNTLSAGSLTVAIEYEDENGVEIYDLTVDQLWDSFENEYRNISEIFVHILDLHYFYASRASVYIPLIWCSWISVPHINGDVRNYVLRSLLCIASKENRLSPLERFSESVTLFKEILNKHKNGKLDFPIISEVLEILDNEELLMGKYYTAFRASLILVDLVSEVFVSEKVRSRIFEDSFATWTTDESDEDSFEDRFEYKLEEGFQDEEIKSPIAYLLGRMLKVLDQADPIDDIEADTTLQFLALNSVT